MKIKEFSALLHIAGRTTKRLIEGGYIPLHQSGPLKDEINILELCGKLEIDLVPFFRGNFYSRFYLKNNSEMSKYQFNKYWLMQENLPAFKLGKTNYYFMEG